MIQSILSNLQFLDLQLEETQLQVSSIDCALREANPNQIAAIDDRLTQLELKSIDIIRKMIDLQKQLIDFKEDKMQ